VGSVTNGRFVVLGDGTVVDLELGASVGKKWDVGAGASVLVLKMSGYSICIDV
jgi:tetrahydrodipicolinate N-succinyltransferase